MAVCLKCRSPMTQTEATCPRCGFDCPDTTEPWWALLYRQWSLLDCFVLLSVLGLPMAFFHYTSSSHPTVVAYGLGICCFCCGSLIETSAPVFSRIFHAIALLMLLSWPVVFCMTY